MINTVLRDAVANPVRAILTSVRMFIGVLAITGVAAADQLATGYVTAVQEQLRGREALYVTTMEWDSRSPDPAYRMLDNVVSRIGPQPADAALITTTNTQLRNVDRTVEANSIWLRGNLQDLFRRPVITGSWPIGDPSTLVPTVAVNQAAASSLMITELPQAIDLGTPSRRAVVVAVVADAGVEPQLYGQLDEDAGGSLTSGRQDISLYIRAAPSAYSGVDMIVRAAAASTGVSLTSALTRIDSTEEARNSVRVVQGAFALCGVVALIVAGLGIVNIGLAAIRERSRELIIRRAIGARRVDIVGQVVGSHLVVGLAVGVAATIIVLITTYLIVPALTPRTFVADPLSLPWPALALGVGAALATSLLGAVAPAIKAARLPIADALRN